MKSFAIAIVVSLAAASADAQALGYYGAPPPGVPPYPGGRTVVVYPQPYNGIWNRYQARAAQRYYANEVYGYGVSNPYPPAYAYGGYGCDGPAMGYGFGGRVYRSRRDWDDYREELEDRREEYRDWVEDQREALEDREEDAEEEREERIRDYREYRKQYQERQQEAWDNWRERFKN